MHVIHGGTMKADSNDIESVSYSVDVVVKLPQTPEDDSQNRQSCVWKADQLFTIGAWA